MGETRVEWHVGIVLEDEEKHDVYYPEDQHLGHPDSGFSVS